MTSKLKIAKEMQFLSKMGCFWLILKYTVKLNFTGISGKITEDFGNYRSREIPNPNQNLESRKRHLADIVSDMATKLMFT